MRPRGNTSLCSSHFCCLVFSKSVILLLTFELYDYASLFNFVVYVASICLWTGAETISSVRFISILRFVLSPSVIYLLAFEIQDCFYQSDFVVCIALVFTSEGTGTNGCVSLISFLSFILLGSVIYLLTFELWDYGFRLILCFASI